MFVGLFHPDPRVDQIVALLKSLCLVNKHYAAFGISHGDIQPQTVHLDFYKFATLLENPVLYPSASSNLAKCVFDPGYIAALSPLQAEMLRVGSGANMHTCEDLWGIAITVLCYASLSPLEYFYSRQGNLIVVSHINDALSGGILNGQDTVRRETFGLLAKMLSQEPYKRPSVDQILMHPYLRSARTDINLENLEEVQTFLSSSPRSSKRALTETSYTNRYSSPPKTQNMIQQEPKQLPRISYVNPAENLHTPPTPISALIQEIRARMTHSQLPPKAETEHGVPILQKPRASASKIAAHDPTYGQPNTMKTVAMIPRTNISFSSGLITSNRAISTIDKPVVRFEQSGNQKNTKNLMLLEIEPLAPGKHFRSQSGRASIGPKLPLFLNSPCKKLLEDRSIESAVDF